MDEAIEPSENTRRCARATTVVEFVLLGPLSLASAFVTFLVCLPVVVCLALYRRRLSIVTSVMSHLMSCWGVVYLVLLFGLPVLSLSIAAWMAVFAGVCVCLPCVVYTR